MRVKQSLLIVLTAAILASCQLASVHQPYSPTVFQGFEKDESALSLMKRADFRIDQETSGKACGTIAFGAQGVDPGTAIHDGEELLVSQRLVVVRYGRTVASMSSIETHEGFEQAMEETGGISWIYLWWYYPVYAASKSTQDVAGTRSGYVPLDNVSYSLIEMAAIQDALSRTTKHGYLLEPKFEYEATSFLGFGSGCVTVKARVLTLGNSPVAGNPKQK